MNFQEIYKIVYGYSYEEDPSNDVSEDFLMASLDAGFINCVNGDFTIIRERLK